MRKIPYLDPVALEGLSLPIAAVERYALDNGWQSMKVPSPRLKAFSRQVNGVEKPIFFVLPSNETFTDKKLRIAEAISTIAGVEGKLPQEVLELISISSGLKKQQLIEAILKSGAKGRNLLGADLSGADLDEADLSGACLEGANLSDADFLGTNLSGANLSGANVFATFFGNANLRRASLDGIFRRGGERGDARQNGEVSVLSPPTFTNANLTMASLMGAHLNGSNLRGANFTRADLENADLTDADLSGATFIDANVTGTHFGRNRFRNKEEAKELRNYLEERGAIFVDSSEQNDGAGAVRSSPFMQKK